MTSKPHPVPSPPLLPAALRPFPHLARRVPHECQAGVQGVCRRASLAGSAGASAGRMGRVWPPHAVMVACSHPGASAMSEAFVTCCDVWNALIFFFSPHTVFSILTVSSGWFFHPIHGELIFVPFSASFCPAWSGPLCLTCI